MRWGTLMGMMAVCLCTCCGVVSSHPMHEHACQHDHLVPAANPMKRGGDVTTPQRYSATRRRSSVSSSRRTAATSTAYTPAIRIVVSPEDVRDTSKSCRNVGQVIPDFQGGTITCTNETDILDEGKMDALLNHALPAAIERLETVIGLAGGSVQGPLDVFAGICPYFSTPSNLVQSGSPNTDLLLFVAAGKTSGSTIAWASMCGVDQYNRPVAGRMNIGSQFLPSNWSAWGNTPQAFNDAANGQQAALDSLLPYSPQERLIRVLMHEMLHVLGFSYDFFSLYYPKGSLKSQTGIRGKSYPVVGLVSANALAAAKQLLSTGGVGSNRACSKLPMVELEDEGPSGTVLSHLERRVYHQDLMIGVSAAISNGNRLTPLCLGILQDSGLYTILESVPSLVESTVFGISNRTELLSSTSAAVDENCTFASQRCLTSVTTLRDNGASSTVIVPAASMEDVFCSDAAGSQYQLIASDGGVYDVMVDIFTANVSLLNRTFVTAPGGWFTAAAHSLGIVMDPQSDTTGFTLNRLTSPEMLFQQNVSLLRKCTYDALSFGTCGLSVSTTSVPSSMQYFAAQGSPSLVGNVSLLDRCPMVMPSTAGTSTDPTASRGFCYLPPPFGLFADLNGPSWTFTLPSSPQLQPNQYRLLLTSAATLGQTSRCLNVIEVSVAAPTDQAVKWELIHTTSCVEWSCVANRDLGSWNMQWRQPGAAFVEGWTDCSEPKWTLLASDTSSSLDRASWVLFKCPRPEIVCRDAVIAAPPPAPTTTATTPTPTTTATTSTTTLLTTSSVAAAATTTTTSTPATPPPPLTTRSAAPPSDLSPPPFDLNTTFTLRLEGDLWKSILTYSPLFPNATTLRAAIAGNVTTLIFESVASYFASASNPNSTTTSTRCLMAGSGASAHVSVLGLTWGSLVVTFALSTTLLTALESGGQLTAQVILRDAVVQFGNTSSITSLYRATLMAMATTVQSTNATLAAAFQQGAQLQTAALQVTSVVVSPDASPNTTGTSHEAMLFSCSATTWCIGPIAAGCGFACLVGLCVVLRWHCRQRHMPTVDSLADSSGQASTSLAVEPQTTHPLDAAASQKRRKLTGDGTTVTSVTTPLATSSNRDEMGGFSAASPTGCSQSNRDHRPPEVRRVDGGIQVTIPSGTFSEASSPSTSPRGAWYTPQHSRVPSVGAGSPTVLLHGGSSWRRRKFQNM